MRYLFFFFVLLLLTGNQDLSAQCDNCYDTPFLGIYSNGISKKKAEKLSFENTEGSYVTGIIGNTAAKRGGLQPFDYVYGIDEYRTDHGRSLTSILRKYDPGDEVTVHFYRMGKKENRKVRLGTRKDAEYAKKSQSEDPFLGIEQISKNWDDEYAGVRVNVVNNSTAKEIGLEDGDIISYINGFPILDWTDVGTAIDMTEVGNTMTVQFIRDSEKRSTSGEVKSYAATKRKSSSHSYAYTNKYKDKDKNKIKNHYHYNTDEKVNVRVDVQTNDGQYFGNNSFTEPIEASRRDVDGMEVELNDLSPAKARDMNDEYGLDLATDNSLSVTELNMSPNPNKGNFVLRFDLANRGSTEVEIFNQAGRNIYHYDLGEFSGDFEDTVDLAQNGPGTYYLQISQGGKSSVKELKLSKQ